MDWNKVQRLNLSSLWSLTRARYIVVRVAMVGQD
eukprot:COSAG01_NODE_31069_length_604_cov_1.118812_1_plen_33_part_10